MKPVTPFAAVLASALLILFTLPARSEEAASIASEAEAPADHRPLATPRVEALHAALLKVMESAKKLGYQGRFDELDPIVRQTFDLELMAEKSVGRYWKTLDAESKDRWQKTFAELITANYAGRFSGYSGEAFETLGEESAIRGTRVVRTRLTRPGDDDVRLNYRLHETPDGWKIIDIYLNGTVSELALRRSEYSSVISREGFDKLLATIDDKVASLKTESS